MLLSKVIKAEKKKFKLWYKVKKKKIISRRIITDYNSSEFTDYITKDRTKIENEDILTKCQIRCEKEDQTDVLQEAEGSDLSALCLVLDKSLNLSDSQCFINKMEIIVIVAVL